MEDDLMSDSDNENSEIKTIDSVKSEDIQIGDWLVINFVYSSKKPGVF